MAQIRPASQGSEGLRRERTLASPQFADGVFRNPSGLGPELQGGTLPVLGEYLFGGSRERSPKGVLPIERPHEAWLRAPETGFRTTWLGHSTVLLEIDGYRVLTDPVFGMRASPLGFAGPKRFHPTPASIHELPPLDAVVLSHNHYDHLCAESIAALAEVDVPIITALGVGAALSRIGIPESRIVELDWGDETWVRGLRICGTPAQHFSGRGVADRNRTLWMSIVLQTDKRKVFFSGDTGLTEQFLDIGTLHGPFDLVMLEVGAFHPAWGDIHLGPENALLALESLGDYVGADLHPRPSHAHALRLDGPDALQDRNRQRQVVCIPALAVEKQVPPFFEPEQGDWRQRTTGVLAEHDGIAGLQLAEFCRRWAAPTGIVLFALLIVQANTGMLSGYRRDATVRSVGVGWHELAREIESVRARVGAACVLAPDYGTTSWLAFYLPKGTCVAQQGQRIRWINMGEPDASLLRGKLLYVDDALPTGRPFLKNYFAHVEKVGEVQRKRGPLVVETYLLELVGRPRGGDPFDRSPPPELQK